MENKGKKPEPVYQVVGWQDNFEGAKSKGYNHKTSCQMPTKHGLGYKRLVMNQDGAALFGAWCALIQVLSRHGNPRDGYCTINGKPDSKPYNPSDLELLTGIQAKHFAKLFQVAANQDIGWIRIPQGYHTDTIVSSDSDLDLDSDSDLDSNACAVLQTDTLKVSAQKLGELGNVLLTNEEYEKLKSKHKAAELAMGIEILDGYLAQPRNANRYKNHYAVLKETSWVWDRVREKMANQPPKMSDYEKRIADGERRYREAIS